MKRWSTTRHVMAFSTLVAAGMLGCQDAVFTGPTGPLILSKDSAAFRARLASEGTAGIPSFSHTGGTGIGVPIHTGESAVITITSSECAGIGTVLTVSGAVSGTISGDACRDAGASLTVGPASADGLLFFTMTDPRFGSGTFRVSGSSPSFTVLMEDGFGDLDFNDAILAVVLRRCAVEGVPKLSQSNDDWGNETYDDSDDTISILGCALTAAAMVLRSYGIVDGPNGEDVNPKTLNEFLKGEPDGYINANINWLAVARFGRQAGGTIAYKGRRADLGEELCSANLVILEHLKPSGGQHFTVATGQTTIDGEPTRTINDPGHADRTSLRDGYNNTFNSVRLFRNAEDPGGIIIAAGGNVEFLVTDPRSRRIGIDPATGTPVSELLDASYSVDFLAVDDPPDSDKTTAETTIFETVFPVEGLYRIDVHGAPGTEYTLTIYTYDIRGDLQSILPETRTLGPDGTATHLLDYSFSDDDSFPPGGPAAFVINRGTSFAPARTVAVVNIDARTIEQEIEVGERPTSMAVTPDGSFLYVTVTGARGDRADDAIAVISVPDLSLRQTIPAGDGPWGIDITPDGEFAYVSHVFEANVGVLRLSDNTFIETITSPFFDTPQGVAITPNGRHVYVANVAFLGIPGASPNVTVIETASNTVLAAVDLTGLVRVFGPWDVVVTPDGKKAYANDGDRGRHVFEIDSDPSSPRFNEVTGDILVGGSGPRGMESGLTPAGVRVYAALAQSDEVIAIDPATQEIVARVATGFGTFPWRVRLNPDGTELWVSLRSSGEVLVLDTQTHGEIARISGFDRPADIAFGGLGVVPFGGFRIERAHAKRHKKKFNRDRLDVRGRLAIGNASDGIDALVEQVTVTFDQFSQTIPAGSFVRKGKNLDKLKFKAPRGTPGIRRIEIRDDGRFSVKARDIDLSAIDFPGLVAFALQIGNDIGQAEIRLDEKGRFRFGPGLAPDVQDIIDDVSALVPDALTERQADRLIKKLEKAQEDLERGRTKGAVKQLESFIKSVLRLKDDGFILDEADFLVEDAQDLIDMVLDLQ